MINIGYQLRIIDGYFYPKLHHLTTHFENAVDGDGTSLTVEYVNKRKYVLLNKDVCIILFIFSNFLYGFFSFQSEISLEINIPKRGAYTVLLSYAPVKSNIRKLAITYVSIELIKLIKIIVIYIILKESSYVL